jgi:nucleotide-binding universal stress UspA family protein
MALGLGSQVMDDGDNLSGIAHKEVPMFNKILVPLDGSVLAERALVPAFAIAQQSEAEVILLRVPFIETVVIESPFYGGTALAWRDTGMHHSRERANDYLQAVRGANLKSNLQIHTRTPEGDAAEAIVAAAASENADLIVMSSHGYSGLTRWVLGSVAERVLHNAPCPVLVVRETDPLGDVLIPLDGSPIAESALAPGLEMATINDAEVKLLRAVETVNVEELAQLELAEKGLGRQLQKDLYDEANTYLHLLAKAQARAGVTVKVITRIGPAAMTILDYAEANDIGLIVMATHGRTGLKRWVYGSVTEKVLHGSKHSMLVIRAANIN